MLEILYPFSFLASLTGLITWFYVQGDSQKSRRMSQVFLGGFFVYLFSLAFSEGELSYKLLILFRDLMVLGLVSQFFSFFKKHKMVFFTMLAVLYGAFFFKYKQVMQDSFPQHIEKSVSEKATVDPPQAPTTTDRKPWQTVDGLRLAKKGELLVELKENQQLETLKQLADQYQLKYQRSFQPADGQITDLDDYVLIDVPTEQLSKLSEIMQALYDSGLIDWAEENEWVQIDDPKLSTAISRQKPDYQLNDPALNRLWGFEAMKVDRLNQYLKAQNLQPKKKAAIFILDTGVDAQHEDLKANYRSIRSRYDNDPVSHGTHCAGIAAAVSNNGKGIASFSYNNEFVTVSSIKVLRAFGGGTQSQIIKGMIEAADKGADVISMSLGGPANRQRTRAYQQAVEYANKKGAIVVVAAGNSNANASGYAPANTPGVITVAAIDTSLNRASFSNRVQDLTRGIAAPGVSIYSTTPKNNYAAFNGTSMATPYVAGLLGLLKSLDPSLDTDRAYKIIHETGKELESGRQTGKLIQPEAAVKLLMESI
ncbi:MAG: S8 family serine peptidase [Bacteroidota bacterium]